MSQKERTATHAGSWYSEVQSVLDRQLGSWLDAVPGQIDGVGRLPVPNARVIIAPHAGYSYSGPAAAWAYASWDVSNAKRVFILGPSHHHYLESCAVTPFETYGTPLSSLVVDKEVNQQLLATEKFITMSRSVDEDEHSIEMHLPYVYKILQIRCVGQGRPMPRIVPILVGAISAQQEVQYGKILKDYLLKEENAFVVSSDFCHWGTRFAYTYYIPNNPQAQQPNVGYSLNRTNCQSPPQNPPIWSSIEKLDRMAINAIESGRHQNFTEYLRQTKNTVCGRHPIGVLMAGLEDDGDESAPKGTFTFVRYEQSSRCSNLRDSSVSYASAYAVVKVPHS